MMKFELGLEEPDPKRAVTSASTIAFAYIAGGFIPLSPYMLTSNTARGLVISAVLTLAALAIFGFAKAGTQELRRFEVRCKLSSSVALQLGRILVGEMIS